MHSLILLVLLLTKHSLSAPQVKIWEDRKAVPLAVFRPHDGNPVNSVAFLTAPDRPDHIVLITGVGSYYFCSSQ
jgi:hypothetical protein